MVMQFSTGRPPHRDCSRRILPRSPHNAACRQHAGDGLMRGILTGDVAAPTGNAEILIDACLHHVIEVQVLQSVTLGTARPTNSSMRLYSLSHPSRPRARPSFPRRYGSHRPSQRCRPAHCRAKRHELHRIAPFLDAADAGNRQAASLGVAGDFRDHVQRDGLHNRPAHAAMRAHAAHRGPGRHRVNVDAHHRVDRVDERDGIRAALFRGLGRAQDASRHSA